MIWDGESRRITWLQCVPLLYANCIHFITPKDIVQHFLLFWGTSLSLYTKAVLFPSKSGNCWASIPIPSVFLTTLCEKYNYHSPIWYTRDLSTWRMLRSALPKRQTSVLNGKSTFLRSLRTEVDEILCVKDLPKSHHQSKSHQHWLENSWEKWICRLGWTFAG